MKIRFASALLALALPLCAQDSTNAAAQAEGMFYKAFYLEKGPRDFAGAMALYEQFLAAAPGHKLATEAAKQQFNLLDKTGKTKERDAFRAKYEKLLGNAVAVAGDAPGAAPAAPAGAGEGRPQRGEGEARGPGGGRFDPAAQQAELEKQIEKAKADGNEEEVKRLTQRLERIKQMAAGGVRPGQGGRGMGVFGNKKLADMTAEEMTQFKDGLGMMEGMLDRMRERMDAEQVKKLEENLGALKKHLDAGKVEDAQKALDAVRELMPRRQRGGEGGGDAGGQGGGRGPGGGQGRGEGGGRGGNSGGGNSGGGNSGGGGGGGR
ncbi:MAG: hypothetical protein JNK49_22060 [Planctomycetes bacterium]|nr:hypothetical protein [Planctomycetota bacterium]